MQCAEASVVGLRSIRKREKEKEERDSEREREKVRERERERERVSNNSCPNPMMAGVTGH